jgi:hypothetical protein
VVEGVALTGCVFTQIDLALEILQLTVPRHDPLPGFHVNSKLGRTGNEVLALGRLRAILKTPQKKTYS